MIAAQGDAMNGDGSKKLPDGPSANDMALIGLMEKKMLMEKEDGTSTGSGSSSQ